MTILLQVRAHRSCSRHCRCPPQVGRTPLRPGRCRRRRTALVLQQIERPSIQGTQHACINTRSPYGCANYCKQLRRRDAQYGGSAWSGKESDSDADPGMGRVAGGSVREVGKISYGREGVTHVGVEPQQSGSWRRRSLRWEARTARPPGWCHHRSLAPELQM